MSFKTFVPKPLTRTHIQYIIYSARKFVLVTRKYNKQANTTRRRKPRCLPHRPAGNPGLSQTILKTVTNSTIRAYPAARGVTERRHPYMPILLTKYHSSVASSFNDVVLVRISREQTVCHQTRSP